MLEKITHADEHVLKSAICYGEVAHVNRIMEIVLPTVELLNYAIEQLGEDSDTVAKVKSKLDGITTSIESTKNMKMMMKDIVKPTEMAQEQTEKNEIDSPKIK